MFNIQAAIDRMYQPGLTYIGTVGPKSKGRCAAAVRQFIEAGGISTAGRPGSACHYKSYLPTIGFNCIATLYGRPQQAAWSTTQGRPGDIAVMDHGVHGHICMWNGKEWVSDFFQGNRMWVYSGDGTCFIFRYAGMAIPGMVNFSMTAMIEQSRVSQQAPENIRLKRLWSMYAKKFNTSTSVSSTTSSGSTFNTSDSMLPTEIINFISQHETGKSFGYTMGPKDLNGYNLGDAKGHKTFGYGLLYHPSKNTYMDMVKSTWTQPELEALFIEHVNKFASQVQSWASRGGISLSPRQLGALTSAVFNCGPGFLKSPTAQAILAKSPSVGDLWRHHSDKLGVRYPGLIRRRAEESQLFLQG